MKRSRELRSRIEVTEGVREMDKEMQEKIEDMDDDAHDVEVIHDLQMNLEGGTIEGIETVEESVNCAAENAEQLFERDDEELENIESKSDAMIDEIQEDKDRVEEDAERIDQAEVSLLKRENYGELQVAKDRTRDDAEFLDSKMKELTEANELNRSQSKDLRERVNESRND